MKRVLRVAVVALLLLTLFANVGLLAGIQLTREPAPAPLSAQRVLKASRPAIVLIQSNYTVSASLPQPVITDAAWTRIDNQLQPRFGRDITNQAQYDQAAMELVLSNPDAYYSAGSSISDSFAMGATGSGFFVTEDGYLVTAAHVVSANKDEIQAEMITQTDDPQFTADLRNRIKSDWASYSPTSGQIDGLVAFTVRWYKKYLSIDKVDTKYYVGTGTVETGDRLTATGVRASVVSIDPTKGGHDIAIMKAAVTGVPALSLAAGSPHLGQATFAIGYPRKGYLDEAVPLAQTIPATMTEGKVLLVDSRTPGWTAWGTSAEFTHGDSGGPVLDANGSVLGVISYAQTDAQGNQALGSGFFVPSQWVVADLASQGVKPTSKPTDLTPTYYKALHEGDNQRYKNELVLLEDIQARSPFHAYVKDDISSTQSQVLAGNDKTPPDLTVYEPAAAEVSAGVVLLAILVWIGLGITGRRRRLEPAPEGVTSATTEAIAAPVPALEPPTEVVSDPAEVLRDSAPLEMPNS